MLKPPFKLASSMTLATAAESPRSHPHAAGCCDAADPAAADAGQPAPAAGRARLGDLDAYLHCSVIGTCIATAELRKLMARFVFVRDMSDAEVHHEAVAMAAQGGVVTRALHKALDRRFEAVLQRFSRLRDADTLRESWEEALRQGDVPGVYWAVLTHPEITPALRQKVFGDVHMLSHLAGAANRADIRRLVALERENEELRERAERQQLRSQEALDERDDLVRSLRHELAVARTARADVGNPADVLLQIAHEDLGGALALVAVQTERRERAELATSVATDEAVRLRDELGHMTRHAEALGRELAAGEALLQVDSAPSAASSALADRLSGRRVFYVGGRPSSTPAIRDLVQRHGGAFQRHDGGLEDRKGLLASGVAWAELVVFPVDCIDHDSASNLKRLCTKQGVPFVPLRCASVASFAAALAGVSRDADDPGSPTCLRHG